MSQNNHVDNLIIGAGPAGLACAWELARHGQSVLVVEQGSKPGGLARTLTFGLDGVGDFHTDIGPHRFLSRNAFINSLMEDAVGLELVQTRRQTSFDLNGQRFRYPPQLGDVMQGMGAMWALRCLLDVLQQRVRGWFPRQPVQHFEDYALRQFGRSLADVNILRYTEKVWGLPCRQISADWAAQRLPGVTLRSLITHLFRGAADRWLPGPADTEVASLAEEFWYPRQGAGRTYELMCQKLQSTRRAAICTNTQVTRLQHDGRRLTRVICTRSGHQLTYVPTNVVSTMLLGDLLQSLSPAPPERVLEANRALRHRSQVYVFLMIAKEQVGTDNWVYFPSPEVPFARFYEPTVFSRAMAPPGYTSLLLEHFVDEGDDVWNASPEHLVRSDIQWLTRLGYLSSPSDVIGWRCHRERSVYPLYDLSYHQHLETVHEWVSGFENLQLAGRGGRFRYTNQDFSMEMGVLAAQSILRGERLDVEDVQGNLDLFDRTYRPLGDVSRTE